MPQEINANVKNVEIYSELSELQGHTVKAKIELKNKSDGSEIVFQKWCQENISNYKIPRFIFN